MRPLSSYDEERAKNPKDVILRIFTRAPSKWRLVDLERREVYRVIGDRWILDQEASSKLTEERIRPLGEEVRPSAGPS